MEVNLTDQGTLEVLWDKWDVVVSLAAMGFGIAIVIAVVVAGARIGWRAAPYVLALAVLAYLFV